MIWVHISKFSLSVDNYYLDSEELSHTGVVMVSAGAKLIQIKCNVQIRILCCLTLSLQTRSYVLCSCALNFILQLRDVCAASPPNKKSIPMRDIAEINVAATNMALAREIAFDASFKLPDEERADALSLERDPSELGEMLEVISSVICCAFSVLKFFKLVDDRRQK